MTEAERTHLIEQTLAPESIPENLKRRARERWQKLSDDDLRDYCAAVQQVFGGENPAAIMPLDQAVSLIKATTAWRRNGPT